MVSQYHYTTWPDHGVPSRPTSLLGFVKKASAANPTDAGPMVRFMAFPCIFETFFWGEKLFCHILSSRLHMV